MTEKKLFIFGGNKVGGSLSFENIRADCWSFGAKVIDVVYPWFRNEGYRRGIAVVYSWFRSEGYRRGIAVVPERRL